MAVMTAGTEFPIDPLLVAAVEKVYETATKTSMTFTEAPRAWHDATYRGKRTQISNRPHKRALLAKKYGRRCAFCGDSFNKKLSKATLDHVIPHEIVQHSSIWNLVLACESCNNHKGNGIPDFMMPLLSALVYRLATLNAAPIERGLVLANSTQDQQEGGQTA